MARAVEVKQRCAAVDRRRPLLSVARQCKLLDISRSGLYYQPVGVSDEDLNLMKLIDRQYMVTPFYGIRKRAVWLKSKRYSVNPETYTAADAINGFEGHLPPSPD